MRRLPASTPVSAHRPGRQRLWRETLWSLSRGHVQSAAPASPLLSPAWTLPSAAASPKRTVRQKTSRHWDPPCCRRHPLPTGTPPSAQLHPGPVSAPPPPDTLGMQARPREAEAGLPSCQREAVLLAPGSRSPCRLAGLCSRSPPPRVRGKGARQGAEGASRDSPSSKQASGAPRHGMNPTGPLQQEQQGEVHGLSVAGSASSRVTLPGGGQLSPLQEDPWLRRGQGQPAAQSRVLLAPLPLAGARPPPPPAVATAPGRLDHSLEPPRERRSTRLQGGFAGRVEWGNPAGDGAPLG